MIYIINNIEWIHIKEFAHITSHSAQAIRNLVFHGNRYRPLTAIRDRSRILIAKAELGGFPFPSGSGIVFHYNGEGNKKEPCPDCTAGKQCAMRQKADMLFDTVTDEEISREREIARENEEEAIYE